ncbi:MAG: lysophospholipid acyltransferase family protein [Ignavibacteria bacterium]|nr:lysophospholipid acyltransferase family protein [Ignavibacteria bacterium]
MREFLQNLGIKILPTILNLLVKTLRIEIENSNFLKMENFVLMFWHGKMLCGWWLGKNKNFYGVVSQSKDGEILSRLLKKWNYKLIRGSSSKDGKEVMQQMVEALKNGYSLAITPDGPKGPREKMKIGGLIAAVRSEKPIILCGIKYEKKIVFNSWDKFELPKPFSKVFIRLSEPKKFPLGLSNEEYEKIRQELELELVKLSYE